MNAITLEASSDPDVEQFSINGEVMPGEYLWQDEDMGMTVSAVLHGNASYVGELPENTEPVMSVEFDEDEAEALFAQYDDGDARAPLTAFRIHLHVGDTELLLDKCKADITLKMKRELVSADVVTAAFSWLDDDISDDSDNSDDTVIELEPTGEDSDEPQTEELSPTEGTDPNETEEQPSADMPTEPQIADGEMQSDMPDVTSADEGTDFNTADNTADELPSNDADEPQAADEETQSDSQPVPDVASADEGTNPDATDETEPSGDADEPQPTDEGTAGEAPTEPISEEPSPTDETQPDDGEQTPEQPQDDDQPDDEPQDEPAEIGQSFVLIITDGKSELACADLSGTEDLTLTFSIRANESAAAVLESNPKYTLQHYLYFSAIATSQSKPGNNSIPFINTSLGTPDGSPSTNDRDSLVMSNHPENEGKRFYAFINDDGKLRTDNVLVPLFVDEDTDYYTNSQINYMSRLYNGEEDFNGNYTLSEIWVYTPQAGKERPVDSLNPADFRVYEVPEASESDNKTHLPERIRFTNNPANTHIGAGATPSYPYDQTILIQNDSIVRLVFDYTTQGDDGEIAVERGANFFDYDITDGYVYTDKECTDKQNTSYQQMHPNTTLWTKTKSAGINSDENYDEENTGIKFLMGNARVNPGTDVTAKFRHNGVDNFINKYNYDNDLDKDKKLIAYEGCSFGLVSGLSQDGYGLPIPVFSDGIRAPDLFSMSNAIGKTAYQTVNEDGTLAQRYSLGFFRQGGTYTLSYVKDTQTGNIVADNLREFKNPQSQYASIWTNEFWPMDNSGSHGTDGHDLKFGDESKQEQRRTRDGTSEKNEVLPPADAGNIDHNSYFGMSFTVDFVIEPGYCGPLAYWFYGDDDLWVFLDELDADGNPVEGKTRMVVDIGGVHSSAGEYANLWEYVQPVAITEEFDKYYRLSIIYDERGASGSTCYMRFTVPLTTSTMEATPRDSELVFEKVVLGEMEGTVQQLPYDPKGELYEFELTMVTEGGASYEDIYNYAIYKTGTTHELVAYNPDYDGERRSVGTIGTANPESGKYEFKLRNGEYIVITGLPDSTFYTIEEKRKDGDNFVTQYQRGTHTHIPADNEFGYVVENSFAEAVRYDHIVGNPVRINAEECNYICFINSSALKTEVSPGDGKGVLIGDNIIYDIEWANETKETGKTDETGEGDVESNILVITDVLDEGLDFVGAKFMKRTYKQQIDPSEPEPGSEPKYELVVDNDYVNGWWAPSSEDYHDDDELLDITYDDGLLEITYDKKTRTVSWTLQGKAIYTYGRVALKVRVNEKAREKEDHKGKFGTLTPRVENEAKLTFTNAAGTEQTLKTNIVENPVWEPIKDEVNPGDKVAVVSDDTITYTIDWKNYLNEAAGVRVRDPLDSSVIFDADSINNGADPPSAEAYIITKQHYDEDGNRVIDRAEPIEGAEITYDEDTRTIYWDLGEQPPEAEGYVKFTVTVNEDIYAYADQYKDVRAKDKEKNRINIWNWGWVKIGEEDERKTNEIVNPIYSYELPSTGGGGTAVYVFSGLLLMSAAALMLCRKRGKECCMKNSS